MRYILILLMILILPLTGSATTSFSGSGSTSFSGSGSTGFGLCDPGTTDHDGLFDDMDVGRTGFAAFAGGSYAQFTLSSDSTITKYELSVVCSAAGGAVDIAIYNDSSDTLGTIVADTTVSITGITNTGWSDSTAAPTRTATLGTPKSLSSGTYWIGAESVTGTCVGSYNGSGGDRRTIKDGGAPSTFTNLHVGIYGCTP